MVYCFSSRTGAEAFIFLFILKIVAPEKEANISRKYDIMFFVDTLFYLISLFSFAFGLLNLGGIFFLKNQLHDRGTWTLTLPLMPLLLITVLLIIEYYLEYRYPVRAFTSIVVLLEWSRIAIAFSWNFITYYHYDINDVERMRKKAVYITAAISIFLCALSVLFLYNIPAYMPIIHISVILLLYHAGIRAVLILRKKKNLLPSTRTGVAVAVISLIIYPAIGIGDPLGWRLPLLNPGMSLWVQSHPIYFTIINIPFVLFVIRGLKTTRRIYPMPEQELEQIKLKLSTREKEVLDLLLQGLSYQRIAEILFISLPTVKTHIQHIYYKFEIKRREELFIKFGRESH